MKYKYEFLGIPNKEDCFSEARTIHKGLHELLGAKRAFFDQAERGVLHLSSLDILAYAYLKRECRNTNKLTDAYLKGFDNLIEFKKNFDARINQSLAVNAESL